MPPGCACLAALCCVLQEALTDLLSQHEEAHTASVAALAQLAAALAAAAGGSNDSNAGGSSAKQTAATAGSTKQLLKQLRSLQRQMLSGAGLRSIIKQAALVELQRDTAAGGSSDNGSSSSGGRQEDVVTWGLRLLVDCGWRSKAQEAFGHGSK